MSELRQRFGCSERKALHLLKKSVSPYRYESRKRDETALKLRIKEITQTRVHYGGASTFATPRWWRKCTTYMGDIQCIVHSMRARVRSSPAGLDRQMVITAAMRLIADEGAAGLSMRSLASALAVTPMALYNHVRNKDELIEAMLDDALGRVDVPRASDPLTVVRGIMLSTFDVLTAHRELVPLYLEKRGARGPNAIRLGQNIHEALEGLNICQDQARRVLRALIIQAIGFAAFAAAPSDSPVVRVVFRDSLDWTLSGALSSAPPLPRSRGNAQ